MVKHEINIKRATPADAQLLSDLSTITFIETYRGDCPDNDMSEFIDRCYNENIIFKELENPADFYYIAFVDGLPGGYMRLKEDSTDYPEMKKCKALELKRIYVIKEYQSKKVSLSDCVPKHPAILLHNYF